MRTVTLRDARRLAVLAQGLAGARAAPGRGAILDTVRRLGCLQLDPIAVVARSHELVLWSRLGPYLRRDLESLQWEERRLFEYWAHRASIVPTEDYPIHHLLMRTYPSERYAHNRRTRAWLEENRGLRRYVLRELRRRGPLRTGQLEDRSERGWASGGWTTGRNVERMLDALWTQGKVVVAGRTGGARLWDLADRWFPSWTPRERLREPEIVHRAAERSLRALGIATAKHIENHFTAGRYPGLGRTLERMERLGTIVRARVVDDGGELPGPWYVHGQDLESLHRIEAGQWEPRTTLLSPFDNLIIARQRTEQMFGFNFRMEIYVPKHARRWGYYVLPVLHGDRLVARVDAATDRKRETLDVKAVHVEADGPPAGTVASGVRRAMEELATFVGARDVAFSGPVPGGWRRGLGA
jgi:uncharacterized protein